MGIGIQLVVTICGFAALGWFLDKKFETEPWLLLAGLVFGATGGMISFVRTALRAGGSTKWKPESVDRKSSSSDSDG